MKIKSTYFFLIASLLFSSCAFNKIFLQPTKIPAATTQLTLRTTEDSVQVLFSGNNHQPTFIKNANDTIAFDYTIESVLFKSNNGNLLNGWLLKPKHVTPTITLLHFHGNAGCLLSQFKAISPLVEKGLQVFMFDYSGFGFSEGKASRNNVLTDALSALDYLKTRSEITNTQLLLYGQSLGGHLSAVVAAQRQTDIKGLVMEGAFSSHKDIAAHMVPVLGKIFVKQGYSATKSIQNFYKPLLVIHSTEDKTIPFFMGKKIYEHANVPKEFYEVKECHICAPTFYADSIVGKIKAILKQ